MKIKKNSKHQILFLIQTKETRNNDSKGNF